LWRGRSWGRPGRPAATPAPRALVAAAALATSAALVAAAAAALVTTAAALIAAAAALVATSTTAALVTAALVTTTTALIAAAAVIGASHAGHLDREDDAADGEHRADKHRCSPAEGPMAWQVRHPAHGPDARS
jgi:hypothetical protein